MNLYLISQEANPGYDTYDSAVVCAESPDEARLIHPQCGPLDPRDEDWSLYSYCWVRNPESVTVVLLGTAQPNLPQIVCKSYNAG